MSQCERFGGTDSWGSLKSHLKTPSKALPDCGGAEAEPAWFGREMLNVTKRSYSPEVLDEVQADKHRSCKALGASAILLGWVCETG